MIRITVLEEEKQYQILCEEKKSIMQALLLANAEISALCGGKGICGKCKIKFFKGKTEPSDKDRKTFSEKELEDGYRLACTAYPRETAVIQLYMQKEQKIKVVAETEEKPYNGTAYRKDSDFGIAVDIGTTTIAMQLLEKSKKESISAYTGLNPQRSYGADVMSRIDAANHGWGEQLQKKIEEALEVGFSELIGKADILKEKVEEIIISGNTTMIHLLLGYSCETLGVAPFIPVNTGAVRTDSEKLFPNSGLKCSVKIIPGFSAFVGGDITAGLYYCQMQKKEGTNLFIDLGTNGEMAIGNREKILVTSVAAGPAFEGGNISCGIGSVPGAICKVDMKGRKIESLETIDGKEPLGICGSGVLEAVFELVKEAIIDETGLLEEPYFDNGFLLDEQRGKNPIVINQKDIREIQLAKSAVRAGIEVLLKRFGSTYKDIENVYLSGGFGYYVNVEKAIGIGMLPRELSRKIKPVGNTALAGAKKLLFQNAEWKKLRKLTDMVQEINLGGDKEFQEFYMEYLYFTLK